ncbi:MAG TPA: mechanosensitive ion channel domain-containing protein [Terriglobia bacterium]|nr:mechanosensitive ion channel domain-containing protein [Terriglobia bacterium]
MSTRLNFALFVLLALGVAAAVGLILTRGGAPLPKPTPSKQTSTAEIELINKPQLETARQLFALAATPEERRLADDALREADRELDLEFAAALQNTANQSAPQTPEVRTLQQRIQALQSEIESGQAEVDRLTALTKKAKGERQDSLQQQLDVSQAELSLSKEALSDAKEDLIRMGGDPHSKIQQLVEEHQAADQASSSAAAVPGSEATSIFSPGSLLDLWSRLSAIRDKQAQLIQARDDAYNAAAARATMHDALEAREEKELPKKKEAAERVKSRLSSNKETSSEEDKSDSRKAATAALSSLRRLAEDRKTMAILDQQVQGLQELGSTYNQWIILVRTERQAALHNMIACGLWIVLLLLVMLLVNRLIGGFFGRLNMEQKHRATLHAVVRFGLQTLAVVAILFVVFGKPGQLSTILGLATAGLTVALKDFIVSFMGWFVLMGRNGVHVGDWVEINGVRGEVVEIGLLRTVLLETGNWTDHGQPTGRQVAFLNSFAVEGYYFNFSTSGQWLWDEIQVLIPQDRDPYPLAEKIRDIVVKETEGNQQSAEQEWKRVKDRYGVKSYSGETTVSVKPIDHGVAVTLRYVTRANQRSEVRARLNLAVVKLLHQGHETLPPAENLTISATTANE